MQENRLPNDSTDQDPHSFAYLEANSIEVISIVCFLIPVWKYFKTADFFFPSSDSGTIILLLLNIANYNADC